VFLSIRTPSIKRIVGEIWPKPTIFDLSPSIYNRLVKGIGISRDGIHSKGWNNLGEKSPWYILENICKATLLR
jgi:hypothetical protein